MPTKAISKTLLFTLLLPFSLITAPQTMAADITPPVTTYTKNPAVPNGNNGWYKTPVNVQLNATDIESGVKEIRYKINNGSWQTISFSDSLNLASNPSFEESGASSANVKDWEASIVDGFAAYAQDTNEAYPGFESSSSRIIASGGPWHGINNKTVFAATTPFSNMTASVWVKTLNVTGNALFNVYAVNQDALGNITYQLIGQSNTTTQTVDWTKLSLDFVVNSATAIGVYIDIGLTSAGTLWSDAVTISDSKTSATATISMNSDGSGHTVEFYSIDNAGNTEISACPATNCITLKIDQTPPANWHDSGAYRSLGGAEHELYVFTNVMDDTSGLSTNSNKYQYTVDEEPGYGRYENLLHCNTPWRTNQWVELMVFPTIPGVHSSLLRTQKTDFCNSDWKICKTVKFHAEDMAGNVIDKEYCINGPWLKFRGKGIVRSNQNIDMIAEPEEDNTDGLVETGGNIIDFFTTVPRWQVKSSQAQINHDYASWLEKAGTTTALGTTLVAANGMYLKDSDFVIGGTQIPNNYDDAVFTQVVFVNGNLRITSDINIQNASAVLFVVKGDVQIAKSVESIKAAIFSDKNFYTAYDINPDEATRTLNLNGLYTADKFYFQRTLQGTNNQKDPASSFTFEPKYLVQMRDFFGKNNIIWKSVE